ncbi:MAG: hypothetical protein ACJ716_01795 [Marmoricola sp.]
MRSTGSHRSSNVPLWCQISIQVLGTVLVAAALMVSAVTDPDRPVPVQQAELR